MDNPTASFDILPATPQHIDRLTHIHVVTCEQDNAFKLYFDSTAEFSKRVSEMLHGQIGDPTWHHAVAVDKATGTVAAWASWWTPADEVIRERDRLADLVDTKPQGASLVDQSEGETQTKTKGDFEFPPGLARHVEQDTTKWINRWTRNRRHILLRALFTDPAFQRRGMGNALVACGNERADRVGLPIFLQASAYGWPVYAKQGFETVQYFDVDLCQWAPGAESRDKGYGIYRFRYMVRLPQTLLDFMGVS